MNIKTELENALIRSVSRYVGYTNGAYDMNRFIKLLDAIKDRPYAYQFELIETLHSISDTIKTSTSAKGVLDFATGLGLLRRIGDSKSRIQPKLVRYDLTSFGKAIRSANHIGESALKNDLFAMLLAENDADMYCLILEHCQHRQKTPIKKYVESRFRETRSKRLKWINDDIQNKAIKRRLTSSLPWIKVIGNRFTLDEESLKESFFRHHVTPRFGWAKELGHVDPSSGLLTDEGMKYLSRFKAGERYEWIGPGKPVLEDLKITLPPDALCGTAIEHFRHGTKIDKANVISATKSHENRLYNLMKNSFQEIKLFNANQASIEVIYLFSYAIEYQTGKLADTEELIRSILKAHSDTLSALSSRNSPVGYYQIRK